MKIFYYESKFKRKNVLGVGDGFRGGGGWGGGVVGVAKENFFYYDFKFKIKKNRVGRRGQGGMARVKVIFYSESKS